MQEHESKNILTVRASSATLPLNTSLGIWLWIYVIGRLLLDPAMLLRTFRHPLDHLYLVLLASVTAVGGAASILILRRKPSALLLVATELALRLFTDWEFYVNSMLHPLHASRNPGIHAIVLLLITLLFGVLPACLWFLYFNQSRRVRSIFGTNLAPWLITPPMY